LLPEVVGRAVHFRHRLIQLIADARVLATVAWAGPSDRARVFTDLQISSTDSGFTVEKLSNAIKKDEQ